MTTFDDRERAFENLFAHDQDLAFRARARRDHELGLWASRHLGLADSDAEGYAEGLVAVGIGSGGDDAVAAKLGEDLNRNGPHVSGEEIKQRMSELLVASLHHVKGDRASTRP